MVSHDRPTPQAAATAAMTFSTWKPIVPLRVIGTSRSGMRLAPRAFGRDDGVAGRRTPVRWPCARCVAMTGWWRSAAKKMILPGQAGAMAATIGSAALSTRVAAWRHVLHDHALEHGQVFDRGDVVQAQVVALADVGDHGHLAAVEAQALAQDAAARGLEHGRIDLGVQQHVARALGAAAVAAVDLAAVDVDAVGVGHADAQAAGRQTGGRSGARSWSCRWCR